MAWNKAMLDAILVPTGVCVVLAYHIFLLFKIRNDPMQTVIGFNNVAKRAWVRSIMKDVEKNILAVQTLRNSIMASTLMASTAILLTSGIAAFLSSSYSVKRPLQNAIYGAHDDFSVSVKFLSLLICFLLSFLCYMQSIRFVNNVNYLINIPIDSSTSSFVTPDVVGDVLVKGFVFYSIGTRAFYVAFPLVLWIYGPIPVFLCCLALVPVLYHLDISTGDAYGSTDVGNGKPSPIQQEQGIFIV